MTTATFIATTPYKRAVMTTSSRRRRARRHPSRNIKMHADDSREPLIEKEVFVGVAVEDDADDMASNGATTEERDIDYSKAIMLFLIPAMGGVLFGFDIGATSGAITSITSAVKSGTDWYNLSAFQEGLVVSSTLLGGMVGSVCAFSFGSKIGRKTELLSASLLYGMGIATTVLSINCPILCIGRLIYGVGVGLAMHGAPAYISETSPSSLRGIFISLKEALIVFGILSGYFVSFLFVDNIGGWRYNYSTAFPVILLFGIGMLSLPESPRFLILQGKMEEAKVAMKSICGNISNVDSVVERETSVMASVMKAEDGEASQGSLFRKQNWRPLYITLSLVMFQQATGQPSVLYYAQEILEKAKIFSDSTNASEAAVAMGVWKFLTTLVAATKVEDLGRRPLLLYGVGGLTASLFVLSVAASLGDVAEFVDVATWTSVGALLIYVGAYQFSFGPVVWLLTGELYPLDVRTQGIALCTFTNFGVNFIVSLTLPALSETIGLSSEYLIFGLIGIVSVASIYFSVPETKGKSLEEIQALMSS